ncbi:hypothetical protein TgHK011_009757 [Trichoderma gracile]|nr:hypothetical protein TgHK011_009757 [Trichoderma gracile]
MPLTSSTPNTYIFREESPHRILKIIMITANSPIALAALAEYEQTPTHHIVIIKRGPGRKQASTSMQSHR